MMMNPRIAYTYSRYSSLLKFNSKGHVDANWPGPLLFNEYISLVMGILFPY